MFTLSECCNIFHSRSRDDNGLREEPSWPSVRRPDGLGNRPGPHEANGREAFAEGARHLLLASSTSSFKHRNFRRANRTERIPGLKRGRQQSWRRIVSWIYSLLRINRRSHIGGIVFDQLFSICTILLMWKQVEKKVSFGACVIVNQVRNWVRF